MRRHEVRDFPLLFIGGSSGVGKSTLARLALRLAGSNIEVDLGANTPFILYRTLASSTSLPVFVDEWTRLGRKDTREAFQGIVPLLYTGGIAERGQADLSAMGYQVTAPTIVAGEDTFALDREVERTVCIFPSRASQNPHALVAIQDKPLEAFARTMHRYLVDRPDVLRLDFAPTATRPEYNAMVLRSGWATLRAFLNEALLGGEDVPDIPETPDLSCFERAIEEGHENVYEAALEAGLAMEDANHLRVVWLDPEGHGTFVRVRELLGLIETRRLDIQLPGQSRAMLSYFRERYTVEERRVTPPFGLKVVRAHLILNLNLEGDVE